MRPGFLLAMLGILGLVIFALILIPTKTEINRVAEPRPRFAAEGTPSVPSPAREEPGLAGRAKLTETQHSTKAEVKGTASHNEESPHDARQEQQEARVAARVAELQELSSKRDTHSVETLLSEVRNTDPEIRQAALDAISQSGNRSTIPGLEEAAAQTEDAEVKKAIAEVIEFLRLPTLTEVLQERSATNNNASPNSR